MPSPTTPKATAKKPAPTSPSSSPETPRPGRVHTRRAPFDFGSRLANARNLRPEDAPFATPPHVVVPMANSGVPILPPYSSTFNPGLTQKIGPKYGGEKGSYVSPFDSGGKTPGNRNLPTNSINYEDFEAKYGSSTQRASNPEFKGCISSDHTVAPTAGHTIPFGGFLPTTIPGKGNTLATTVEKNVLAQVPEDAQDRVIFLGPFHMIRRECFKKRDRKGFKEMHDWLDARMDEDLHKIKAVDDMLPEVVYTIKIPMTEADWEFYNSAFRAFPDAWDFQDALAPGKDNLDQVTDVLEFEKSFVGEPYQLTKTALTVPGQNLEEMLARMVKQYRLGLSWDCGHLVAFRPELVPEEPLEACAGKYR